MKKGFLQLPVLLVAVLALMFSSCKKESKGVQDNVASAADVASISHAVDVVSLDAATAAAAADAGLYSTAGKTADFGPGDTWARICGATTVDQGSAGDKTITIVYDNTTKCHGIIRGGIVEITNTTGVPFGHVNAQRTVRYINLKVTDVSTGESHTINGTHIMTNITGGLFETIIDQEVTSGSVTHKNTSDGMTVSYSDGTSRSFTFDRLRTWDLSHLVLTETTSADGANNFESGVDRSGNNYTDVIASPIIDNNYCTWNPYTGTVVHTVGNSGPVTTTLYGTNSTGVQIGGVETCADGYTVTSNGGKGSSKFVSY